MMFFCVLTPRRLKELSGPQARLVKLAGKKWPHQGRACHSHNVFGGILIPPGDRWTGSTSHGKSIASNTQHGPLRASISPHRLNQEFTRRTQFCDKIKHLSSDPALG
jgi:hypothetical protein